MADLLKVTINGTGNLGEISSASVSNSGVTTHSPADPTPAIATVSITGKTTDTAQFLSNNDVHIEQMNGLGSVDAVVDTVSVGNATTNISGPTPLSRFITGNINIPALASGTPASAMDLAMQLSGEQRASNTYSGGTSKNMRIYTMNGHGAGFGPGGQLLDFPDTTNWMPFTRAGVTFKYQQSVSYSPPSFGSGFQSPLTGYIYANNPLSNITMKMPFSEVGKKATFNFYFPRDAQPSPEFGLPTGRALVGYAEGDSQGAYLGFDYEASNNRFKLFYESVANPGEDRTVYVSTSGLTGNEWLVSLSFNNDSGSGFRVEMYVSEIDGTGVSSNYFLNNIAPDVPVLLWATLPTMRMVRTDLIPSAWTGWTSPYGISTAADIAVSNTLTSVPISGMNGTIWDYLNQVCSAHNTEVSVVNNVITLRERGLIELDPTEFTSAPIVAPVSNKAEKVSLEWSEAVPNRPVDAGVGGVNRATNPSFETSGSSLVVRTNQSTNPNSVTATGFSPNNGAFHTVTRNVAVTGNPQGITVAARSTVVPGQTTQFVLDMYNVDSLANTGPARRIGAWFYVTGSGYQVRIGSTSEPYNSIAANTWTFVHDTLGLAANAYSGAYIKKISGNAPSSDTAYITGVTAFDAVVPEFAVWGGAASTQDYTFAWTGSPNLSTSTWNALEVVGASENGTSSRVFQSSEWSSTGRASLKIVASSTSSNASFAYAQTVNMVSAGILVPGKTYTALAKLRLNAPQTGTLDSGARTIFYRGIVAGTVASSPAPNVAGTHNLSLTFTVNPSETNGHIRLYNGAYAGNGDVWFDDFLIIEGTYTGDYFDGATPATSTGRYYWQSTPDASRSNWIKRIPDVYGVYNVPGSYSVDVGQTTEVLLDTPNYYSGLIQPEPKEISNMLPPSTAPGYAISGSDNLPIDPLEWLDYGGSLKVETTSIYGQIKMTLVGPHEEIPGVPGPYSFSASDGETSYPLIRIPYIGTQFSEPITTISNTGAASSTTTQIEPVSFSNVCATSWSKVWGLIADAGKIYGGPRTQVTMTIPTAKALGFGLTEGSLLRVRNSTYRVVTVNYNVGTTSITALPYNTYETFESEWSGKTYNDFKALWDDDSYTYEDFSISPLTTRW